MGNIIPRFPFRNRVERKRDFSLSSLYKKIDLYIYAMNSTHGKVRWKTIEINGIHNIIFFGAGNSDIIFHFIWIGIYFSLDKLFVLEITNYLFYFDKLGDRLVRLLSIFSSNAFCF